MAMSHESCTHPRTPAGRRACRAGNTSVVIENQAVDAYVNRIAETGQIKMTGAVARRMARQAAKADMVRIQPRRSGARVSTTSNGCVQAALHIDAHGGRCACGWAAA